MYGLVLAITLLNILLFLLYEFFAIKNAEWESLRIFVSFDNNLKKFLFLFLHVPIPSLIIFYLYAVFAAGSLEVFLVTNILAVLHLALRIFSHKKDSYLFRSIPSFALIVGVAVTGLLNLLLSPQLFG